MVHEYARNTIKLKDCIIQLNTGLNPRKNFSLGNGDIKYITAKNLTQAGYIDFSTCDYIDKQAKEIIHKGLIFKRVMYCLQAGHPLVTAI